ncbi:hypothetical protein GOP47_0002882 [Adiantum capillus-veneris]|uniref:SET domain-containing protein n=1 Tax=Adiantum capillus-veneris TaxID=13818 RepID=A0A9D4ZPK4_ADICA|nr:hypothetical protein GOP47_0002882 [Adiantum capillus-veneris]
MLRLCTHSVLPIALAPRSSRVSFCYFQAQQQQAGEDLIAWVRQNGGHVHPSLRLLVHSSSGLGLAATRPLLSGTPLITLPPHLPLSLPTFPASSQDQTLLQLAQLVPEDLWALKLGLKLLMERAQRGSFWWPYISNLPQRFNIPVFFTGSEIANLQYAPVIHQVKKRCRALLDLAKEVETVLSKLGTDQQPFGGQEVNASSLGWAMAAVSSRAFQMHNSSGSSRVMLPLIDMCNHSFTPNARIIQQEEKGGTSFVVVAEGNLQAGANILLSYGALSNDVLLLDYGFVESQNVHDFVEMRYDKIMVDAARVAARLDGDGYSQLAEWKQSILEQLNFEGVGVSLQVKFGGTNLVDGRLLAALRVLYAQDSDSVKRKGHFPTPITEDEGALKSKELTEAGTLVLEYRIAKKKVLVDCMRGLSRKLQSLERDKF